MFIRVIDDGLEKLLRAELPLPTDVGDITFEAPTNNWSAKLSRLTVNLFLYEVSRSAQPVRSQTRNGNGQNRVPLPMVQLSYLVSAWAGSPRDEHQLLGDVVNVLAGQTSLPPSYLSISLATTVDLGFDDDKHNKPREIWGATGGQLKASFTLQATVAADAFEWAADAPPVRHLEVLTAPQPWTTKP